MEWRMCMIMIAYYFNYIREQVLGEAVKKLTWSMWLLLRSATHIIDQSFILQWVVLMKTWFWCCSFCINLAAISSVVHECGVAWQKLHIWFLFGDVVLVLFCKVCLGWKTSIFDGFYRVLFNGFDIFISKPSTSHVKSINLMPFLSTCTLENTFKCNCFTKQ